MLHDLIASSVTPLNEEEERARRKKRYVAHLNHVDSSLRIAEHLANLRQNRKGKRKEPEETNPVTDTAHPNFMKMPGTKRRKSEGNTKSSSKKKTPDHELSSIFDKLIKQLMALPEAWPFCRPVSKEHFADYYDVIVSPKTLQDIQDGVSAQKYKSAAAVMDDLILIASNCQTYNGSHPLTEIAEKIVLKGKAFMNRVRF